LFVTSYFGPLGDNAETALKLPVDALHIDLVRGAEQLDEVLVKTLVGLILSLGVVGGRNIWGNDLEKSLGMLERVAAKIGKNRIWVSASCSLLYTPYDLDLETALDPELKSWMAYAKQKLREIVTLTKGLNEGRDAIAAELPNSTQALASRKSSPRIHDAAVAQRLAKQPLSGAGRKSRFDARRKLQQARLHLPLYPTITIGSFPQTAELRARRADAKNGRITPADYDAYLRAQVKSAIALQEDIGIDVLAHGEFERNDMVEYFGEHLSGFALTQNGWVQS
jgi:5-methyltetrahydropteroyltriglutamate--homocysteine methyltransferase